MSQESGGSSLWGKQGLRRPGQQVRLEVFRDQKRTTIELPLVSYQGGAERITWFGRTQPVYLVENGFIFLELSRPLLQQAFGGDWKRKAIELAQIFEEQQYYEQPASDRIVVLARILPDPINQGYEEIYMKPVEQLNGQPVQNLRAMAEQLDRMAADVRAHVRLTLKGGQPIFLDLANRQAANQRIQQRYGVPALRRLDG